MRWAESLVALKTANKAINKKGYSGCVIEWIGMVCVAGTVEKGTKSSGWVSPIPISWRGTVRLKWLPLISSSVQSAPQRVDNQRYKLGRERERGRRESCGNFIEMMTAQKRDWDGERERGRRRST